MKTLWLVLTLIPAPFLFHFYEYGQHVQREDAAFLTSGSIFFVVITGFLAGLIRVRSFILVNGITILLSLVLAIYFIPDSGWFKPVGRNGAVIFVGIVFLIGQLIIRSFSRAVLIKREKPV